ncbi:hypothetical protein EDD21DRAFT_220225 [Dissophora ornata]|nr:hypothetical protein EDD21DRAFT_220225 [Dissophora ornata]
MNTVKREISSSGVEFPPQTALDIANAYLKSALQTKDSKMILALCDEAEATLSRIKKSTRMILISSSNVENRTLCDEIVAAYFELGRLVNGSGHRNMAQDSYTMAGKWRRRVQQPGHSSYANLALSPSAGLSTVGPLSTAFYPPIQGTSRLDIA